MSDEQIDSRLAALLKTLKPKTKQPISTKVLNTWIAQAEGQLGDEAKGGRLGWLVASSVAIAAVQRALDEDGHQLFLLKGGTLLQHRLNSTARTTKDVDGLVGVTWTSRQWPPAITAHAHWAGDYAQAAAAGGIDLSLDEAVAQLNSWIEAVARVQ